ncbi:transmembrane E3 ubiquitin-protein ligase FLY2-like isoform X2 [Lotus japonicus]|uniref:transmembrane E3 ubiquitin-protein ligase FLY2-like isoform X2 n=1 Tax=Lotus japonicus TaxID=34305 RepID=UPI00258B44F3|nr:transmembrane E3 ubiquitin-protein ligase FLY2-like isoform X2 [Lotus japonicus]
MESPSADDSGVSFSPLVYNNKVVNYTLMVTFISFLQVLLLIRQMEHSSTQYGAAKVSILMIGQQAIMDAYLCFLHLTGVTLRESLFNAFATAAFSKFVVVSIFEKRYLLAIWEANRPLSHELSVFYSRYYGILLGGLLLIYEFHHYLKTIFLLMSSFWAVILLLQHYLGSRLFIPHQILPEKYCYCRRFDQDTRHAMDCVICMIAIDLSQGTNDCMVTPCDHFFHSGCLQRWMDIKLECPTCRRTLPPA